MPFFVIINVLFFYFENYQYIVSTIFLEILISCCFPQDDWDPDWQSTCSSKVAYLVERLKVLQETNRKIGYSVEEIDNSKIEIYYSKTNYRFLDLQEAWSLQHSNSCKILTEKVIVFSQFLEHINVIEQQVPMIIRFVYLPNLR